LAFYPCDEVLMAIGQENAFPWIERDIGIVFDKWGLPVLDKDTFQSTNPKVFFGGDAAFGPANIITAVAHGHQAAISIDLFCKGKPTSARPAPGTNLVSQKMGIHEWSYDSQVDDDDRYRVPLADKATSLKDRKMEVELGFDLATAFREAERCLNCDVQTVFTDASCIECDACMDICPTDCINFIANDAEPALRTSLKVPATNLDQPLYVSGALKTGRVMVKDENVCLHCGLCAERCPTSAWDMQKFLYEVTKAAPLC
jgi:ferredoxin